MIAIFGLNADGEERLDHVFLVMVNAVGVGGYEIVCCIKKRRYQGIAKASPKEEFYFWILTFPGCPVENIFVCVFEACFAEI